ncbi:YesL family protein [Evansella halocellulosilytica]|uniref:YesL family protein n=1 Tax=Evansella halocellulosilytica TaxID=2011013 RepID=UPI000BB8711D|nr:DUF624 domain-containing protein [Evansella halocellulosilytica]
MQLGGTSGVIYRVTDWILKLAFINVMWILFTILGLGVFGFYPAFIAMTAMIIAWKNGEEPPYFKTFFDIFKRDFLKVNMIALVALILTGILFMNFSVIGHFQGFFYYIFLVSTLMLVLLLWSTLILVAIAVGQSDEGINIRVHFKQAWTMLATNPIKLLALVLTIVIVMLTVYFIPSIAPFYSMSIIAWIAVLLFLRSAKQLRKTHD